jgi:hypothetical protein
MKKFIIQKHLSKKYRLMQQTPAGCGAGPPERRPQRS